MDNKTCQSAVQKHVDKYDSPPTTASAPHHSSLTRPRRYGTIDVLINSAGKQIQNEDFADIDLDDVESTFRSNVLAMFAITKYSVPHMKDGSS